MAQATFSIRMDEGLKKQFDNICNEFGMNVSTAFTVFAKAVVRERKIPFEISAPMPTVNREDALRALQTLRADARTNGLQDMTLDEINNEITQTRAARTAEEA